MKRETHRKANTTHQARAVASRPECGCSVWPCPTCGAKDWEDAGNKCRADWVCSADDQRQLDYEREHSTLNEKVRLRTAASAGTVGGVGGTPNQKGGERC